MRRPLSEGAGAVLMFGTGFFLLLGSASVGIVYGLQETLALLVGRIAPRFLGEVQSMFTRLGVGEYWRSYMLPVFDQPAWMVFATLGGLLLVIGLVRRV